MTPKHKVDEGVRRTRLMALEAAKRYIARDYEEREERLAAAHELHGFGVFTGPQICGWLGLSSYALDGNGFTPGWGAQALRADQIDMAIALASEGLRGSKPKALIHEAYHQSGMSYDMIGGLLGIHKNVVRRIVKRIDGEPWT